MNTISAPLVSVIIPTYNRASIISKAIDSVLNQTYTSIQLIVVDDGSDDNTLEIIKRYPEVEYILQEHGGQGKARNNGLRHAKGSYIASLDSDDVWCPQFLEQCISQLEANNLDFVFSNWLQVINKTHGFDFFLRSKLLEPYFPNQKDGWVKLDYEQLRHLYIYACPSPSSSLVIRYSSIKNGWNETLNIADDWCLILDIIFSKKCKAAFTPNRFWIKHIDGKNIFDGRNYFEVLELLYIQDFDKIIQLNRHHLTESELNEIRQRTARFIYRYTFNRFLNRINIAKSLVMINRALRIAPMLFFVELYGMTTKKLKKKINKIINKENQDDLELIAIPELTLPKVV
jgi:glycosyltransferase involved in cell wall biosynthesis